MKQIVKYKIEISVDFKDPKKAKAHFLSETYKLHGDYEFDTLGDVAGVISQIILFDGTDKDCYWIEGIGNFLRDDPGGVIYCELDAVGRIEVNHETPYHTAIQEVE